MMPQIGPEGQEKLAAARVVSIGAGGVKSPFLLYLAAIGIGYIRIIDFDHVELSNLNRQILYEVSDIGKSKAHQAAARLQALNPDIVVEPMHVRIERDNIESLCSGFDVLIEGGDSPEGRKLVNDLALRTGQPMVHASAQYGAGYVLTVLPGETACLECVFPDPPPGGIGSVPVVGLATGLSGTMGAAEVVKIILGNGRLSTNGLSQFSVFQNEFEFYRKPRLQGPGVVD
jgi:molybdopterin/thiamine biosynthesis adenylyltransferase